MTLKQINRLIAHRQIELVKGDGYFYFCALPGAPFDTVEPASVYTPRLHDLSLSRWLEEAGA